VYVRGVIRQQREDAMASAGHDATVEHPAAPTGGRRVHWAELLFDLVLVTAVGQIARGLHGDPDGWRFAATAALLAVVWWAWVNVSVTMNIFGARVTPAIWACVFAAMALVGMMAVAAPGAFGERAWAFALGNGLIRLVWMVPWSLKRRAVGRPWWRPVVYCLVPAALWLGSIPVPMPYGAVLWAVAVGLEVALLSGLGRRGGPLAERMDLDHLIERVTLVVVIAFGEALLSVISALDGRWAAASMAAAALGFTAVVALAWAFFAFAPAAVERGLHRLAAAGRLAPLRDAVMYLPFLLIAGIVMLAAGVGTAIADAPEVLPPGAVICLAAGVSLFAVASVAESLRYGAPWRDVAPWAPVGVVLPWVLMPLGALLSAVGVLIALACIVVLYATAVSLNARRVAVRRARQV
jgi:low temperature requirement protein LtrA